MSNNNVRKVNRSIVPNGTVRGLEIFQDTTDDKLYYKDGNGNVTPLGSSTVSPENTWEIPTVAFVNPTTGDDLTAVIGDGNKPYATIAAAQAASNIVFLQPDEYTEVIALDSGKTYFSYPGVIFTTGGIVNVGGTLVGTKFLGYAKFFGNQNLIRLDNITLTDVVIEFDSAETTSGASGGCCFIDCDNPSTLTFKCNSLKDIYNGNAFGAVFKGPITGTLDVAESIIGSYGVLALGFSGEYLHNFTVNCPRIVCLNAGGFGNLDPYKQAVNYGGTEAGYKTTINGNIYHEVVGVLVPITLGNFSGCVVARYSGGGTLEINGNIIGGYQRGIVNLSTDSIILNGTIDTIASAFTITTGELLIKNSSIIQGTPSSITGSSKVFIYDTTIDHSTRSIMQVAGTTGTANVDIDGDVYLMTFDTDLETTMKNFITTHAAAILSDSGATVVLSNGRLLFTNILTLNVVTIANVTGDLSGAVNTPLQNVIDNTSATSKLIIRNLEARGFGEFVNTGGVAVAVGMINVSSNLANDAAMTSEYTTLGYTQEANTLVPTFV
jgi:hypothetical protein